MTIVTRRLPDKVPNDGAMDVGQAVVSAGVAVGEMLVVEAQQVQDGRVKVMNVDAVSSDGDSEFVRRTMHDSAFRSSTGQPG